MARELSLPTSTCFGLVRTLVDRGFLYYLRPRGPFYPTRRLGHVALLATTRGSTEKVDFCNDVHRKGLTVVGAQKGGLTDSEGQFTISGIPAGTCEVKVQYLGYRPASQPGGSLARASCRRLSRKTSRSVSRDGRFQSICVHLPKGM